LERVNTSYNAPQGKIESQWSREAQGYRYEITIPEGSIAQVELNKKPSQKITILEGEANLISEIREKISTGKFNLSSGTYVFFVGH